MMPEQLTEEEARLLRALKHRGLLRVQDPESSPTARGLIDWGLVRSIDRYGEQAVLVLSGEGLRVAERSI